MQTLFRFLGDGMQLLVAHHAQHGLGIGNVDPAPLAESAHDHIAWQEQANVWLLLQCSLHAAYMSQVVKVTRERPRRPDADRRPR